MNSREFSYPCIGSAALASVSGRIAVFSENCGSFPFGWVLLLKTDGKFLRAADNFGVEFHIGKQADGICRL